MGIARIIPTIPARLPAIIMTIKIETDEIVEAVKEVAKLETKKTVKSISEEEQAKIDVVKDFTKDYEG